MPTKLKDRVLIFSVFSFIAFIFLSILVANGSLKLQMFDLFTTLKLQQYISRQFDPILSMLSIIGDAEIISFALLFALIQIKRNIDKLIIIFLYVGGTLLELIQKIQLIHPSPPKSFFRYDLDLFLPSTYIQTGHSYPSGHSFRATFIISILIFLLLRKDFKNKNHKIFLLVSFLIFLILMLISRVSLGEHWTTDVIGGTLLALSLALVSISKCLSSS